MAQGDLTIALNKSEYNNIQNKLSQLTKVEQGSIVGNGLKEGIEIIKREGKSNLATRNKKKTGNLSKSFATKLNKKRAAIYAGFKRPAGSHSFLIDRGTKKRWTKAGAYRGSVSKDNPNHGSMFWTDAVNNCGDSALNTLMDAIYNELDNILNK